jgi:fluoride ion exporter CrcB/FEX
MLHDGSFAVAFGTILIHVVGSIMLTILGIYTYQFFK